MDSRFLETFVEVVRHGSLAEAARRQGLTAAAVSLRLRVLEDEIGAPLVERVGRTVRPTSAGRAVHDLAQRIAADVRQLRGLAGGSELIGELRLGAISTAMTGLLPQALCRMREQQPQMDVFVMPGTSPQLYQQLLDEKIDAAIVVRPPFDLSKAYQAELIRAEPLRLMCPGGMAVPDVLECLRSRPFIRYDRNNWGGRLLDRWLRAQDLKLRDWLELDSLDAIGVMVSSGLGISIVPDWARPWPEGLNVQMLALPGAPQLREIVMVWRRAAAAERMVEAMLPALRQAGDQAAGR